MKFRGMWLPLVAAALALPGAAWAQEDDEPRPGIIGVMFDDSDDDDGVRIVEVRRGSPADRAGVEAGDVIVRWNGRDADEAFERPRELRAGDSVRLHIRRRDGGEREVVVVAQPRQATRVAVRRGGDGPVVIVNGDSIQIPLDALTMHLDSMQIPLEAITMRIDSLQTRLLELDDGRLRVQMDSLVHLFRDSAHVFMERMPNMEVRILGPELEAMRLEGDLSELEVDLSELDIEAVDLENEAFLMEQPFFMELGRRAAAGAELAEMNEGLSRYFGNLENGALVIDVSPETPAARAGLQAGDVIVRAGGREVNDPEDVRSALTRAEDGRVALEVVRQGRRRELSLEWDGRNRIIRRELAPARARARARTAPPPPDEN
jgi:hypothetical protein